jgi:Ca-activated chloride channel family protein
MNGELLKDREGNIVVTRLDESVLQDVAKAGDGVYVRAGNSEFGLNPIIDDIRRMEDEKYSSIVFEEFDEQFMYFLGIALFFFMLEMLIGDRRSKRHLFRR